MEKLPLNRDNFYCRELLGGLVNKTQVIQDKNSSEIYVYQQSQEISLHAVDAIETDGVCCEHAGLRQIQVDPGKFLRARKISEFLLNNHFRHGRIIEAADYGDHGWQCLNLSKAHLGVISCILKKI
jgi:hypothetical protein